MTTDVGLHRAIEQDERIPLTLTLQHTGVVHVSVPRRVDTRSGPTAKVVGPSPRGTLPAPAGAGPGVTVAP